MSVSDASFVARHRVQSIPLVRHEWSRTGNTRCDGVMRGSLRTHLRLLSSRVAQALFYFHLVRCHRPRPYSDTFWLRSNLGHSRDNGTTVMAKSRIATVQFVIEKLVLHDYLSPQSSLTISAAFSATMYTALTTFPET
jgi:hypothetical protein